MPLYEYRCPKCGTFEQMRKFSDPLLTACPTCESPVEKLPSAPAIQFKGSGWYITDYARKSSDAEGAKGDGKSGGEARDSGAGKDSGSGKDSAASPDKGGAKESSSSTTKTSDKT